MIILCELPFSHVEKDGFKLFCQEMQPKFHVLSRTTVTKDCLQIFHDEKQKLKDYFKDTFSRVCITSDMWTSIQNLGYIVLTAHFVDKNWCLKKEIINFRVLPHPHKGEAIAKALEGCLLEWGINKVMSITLDNAKNNDTSVVDLNKSLNGRNMLLFGGDFFHVRCFAHVINHVVSDGIDEAKTTVKRLRRCVKYVRSSPSRLQMFKKCASEEHVTSKRVVCLDVKTRWNSTYLMIDAALAFEKAFDRFEEQDSSYKNECEGVGTMEFFDWKKLKSLHAFLEDFYLLTKRISGSHYVTSNTYFDEVSQTRELLMRDLRSDDIYRCAMATKMYAKFEKYCNFESLNPILIVAIVLDPRYKLAYVAFWYKEFLGYDLLLSDESKNSKTESFVENLKALMSHIYQNYKAEATLVGDLTSSNRSESDMTSEMVTKRSSKKDKFRADVKRKDNVDVVNDLERYLGEGIEEEDPHFDVLAWWKGKLATYHALAFMACDILAIPITSVASECAFSTAGRVLDPFRSSLTPNIVECLVCAQDWLRSPTQQIDIDSTLEELEEIESVMTQELRSLTVGN